MDVTVYLPDHIGTRAKEEGLKLSRMLRDAVIAELKRRDAMAEALGETETYEFTLFEPDGHGLEYTGRITGKLIASKDPSNGGIYLTSDGRVLAVYPDQGCYHRIDGPGNDVVDMLLKAGLDQDEFAEACRALGLKPLIDL